MADTQRSTVVGLFQDPDRARDAIEELKERGFPSGDISILMRDKGETKDMAEETGTHAGEGAATGLVGGGILGGIGGWLVGIGALAIPGVGPVIAAGALGTALAGAAIGAGVGAIAGALIGMGIPKEEAEWYEGEVKTGSTLVTVKAEGRYDEARDILRNHGAYDIQNRQPSMTGTNTGYGTGMTSGETYDTGTMSRESYGTGSERWEDVMPRYRSDWQKQYSGRPGATWDSYEPGYRYAWEMHSRPEYSNRSWSEAEPEFRRDWEARHHDKPWDQVADSIRDAWDSFRNRSEGSMTRGTQSDFDRSRMSDQDTMRLREEERVSDTVRREEAHVEREGDFEVRGGENFPKHEHNWVNGRCQVCGATRERRRAA